MTCVTTLAEPDLKELLRLYRAAKKPKAPAALRAVMVRIARLQSQAVLQGRYDLQREVRDVLGVSAYNDTTYEND